MIKAFSMLTLFSHPEPELAQPQEKSSPIEPVQEAAKPTVIAGVPVDTKKPTPKKEKKVPKPPVDDFMLFSTPDIIRRVGGKEPTTPTTPTTPTDITPKPAKIGGTSKAEKRLSQGGDNKVPASSRLSADSKVKGRRQSEDVAKSGTLQMGRRESVEMKRNQSIDGKSSEKAQSEVKKAQPSAPIPEPQVTVHGLDESRGKTNSILYSIDTTSCQTKTKQNML